MSISGPIAGEVEQSELAEEAGQAPERRRRSRAGVANRGEGRLALMLIAPALLLLALVVGYPIIYALYHSFLSDPNAVDPKTGFFLKAGKWIGLSNYKDWVLQQCSTPSGKKSSCPPGTLPAEFWTTVFVTLFYTVVTVILETTIGMAMALMMHRAFKGRGLVRAAILVPWAIPTAVTAKLWVVIFDKQGVFNKVFGTNFSWTTATWPGRFAIIIADVWKTTPFMALLILAGLQVIPAELYESARVDGATAWQRFTKITLPLVKPALVVAVIFRSMDVLRMYDLAALLTPGAPNDDTVSTLVVKQIRFGYLNSASALSTMVFVMIMVIAFLLVKVLGAQLVDQSVKAPKAKKRRKSKEAVEVNA